MIHLRHTLFVLSFLLFASCCNLKSVHKKQYVENKELDLFLLIGQSNMAGRAEIFHEYADTLTGVYLLNDNDCFEKAVNPLNRYSTIRKDISMQKLGPGYSFAKKIVAKTGHNIGLIVNARGGSSIQSWEKNNPDKYYEETLKRVKIAMQYGKLKAVLWHQGEANASTPILYKKQLAEFVNNLRKDLNMPDLFFVAGEISQWNWTKKPEGTQPFNSMIRNINEFIPHSACVSSKELKPLIDETDPHFDTQSQIILGERYADEILKNIYNINH